MDTTETILSILLFIPLLIAIFYLPKFFKMHNKTPNSKLNYIILKYRLKSYGADKLEDLINMPDSKVSQRDKKIITQLLKDEYSL
ncbi:hypothetical protein M2T28_20010 [Elizabethkingia miricola]|uniref:hypothetical protein n=1 Tax=Elizabethkingia miricola TaxID=172045 RepID=UPI00201A158F|nr:hypothetical protein [Elizabethkingia miricola]MCL1654912.1 hypothetical protein [Elizabethkingia miricola]